MCARRHTFVGLDVSGRNTFSLCDTLITRDQSRGHRARRRHVLNCRLTTPLHAHANPSVCILCIPGCSTWRFIALEHVTQVDSTTADVLLLHTSRDVNVAVCVIGACYDDVNTTAYVLLITCST